MKPPPDQQKAPVRALDTKPGHEESNRRKSSTHATDGKPKYLTYHERLLPRAEDAGRQLVASWIVYGPKEINTFDPDRMPTGTLQKVANGVLDAKLNHGVKDFAGIVAYFTDAPQSVRDELLECSQGFIPLPSDCKPLLAILTEYDRTRQREMLAHRLNDCLARGDDPTVILREIAEFEAEGTNRHTLRERAYALRFDPDTPPPANTWQSPHPRSAAGSRPADSNPNAPPQGNCASVVPNWTPSSTNKTGPIRDHVPRSAPQYKVRHVLSILNQLERKII